MLGQLVHKPLSFQFLYCTRGPGFLEEHIQNTEDFVKTQTYDHVQSQKQSRGQAYTDFLRFTSLLITPPVGV